MTDKKEISNGNASRAKPVSTTAAVKCEGCGIVFESRNRMFCHLRDTDGACLIGDGQAYDDYVKYVKNNQTKLIKVLLLYGYIPCESSLAVVLKKNSTESDCTTTTSTRNEEICNGNDAAQFLWQAIQTVCGMEQQSCTEMLLPKLNRSYGCTSRGTDIVAQDDGTGALSEILMLKISNFSSNNKKEEWLAKVNAELKRKFQVSKQGQIQVLDCLEMPHKKFNAEMDVTHRRVEYVLPADFLYNNFENNNGGEASKNLDDFFDSLPSFGPNWEESRQKPSGETLNYLYGLKKLMQLLTTRIEKLDLDNEAAVMEKSFHNKKRKNRKQNPKRQAKKLEKNIDGEAVNKDGQAKTANNDDKSSSTVGKNVLRRKRFHNFTPRVMAHEFLAFRRLDRFHHAATVRFDDDDCTTTTTTTGKQRRPFIILSLAGDLFLHGQVVRVIGLFLALNRNIVEKDIVDCIFDEEYPHLIPTPPAPALGMYAAEAAYTTWEGKSGCILSPRVSNRYPKGFNNEETLSKVKEWNKVVQSTIAQAWLRDGVDPKTGRLLIEQQWTKDVLEPWAVRARQQLQQYREWKALQNNNKVKQEGQSIAETNSLVTQPESVPEKSLVDSTVPPAYEKVLRLLREADASGLWPSTTPKRQLVMVAQENQPASLTMARYIAKSNKEERSSAYGEGGASGSFSIGYMPGDLGNSQPRANTLFPELVKAAFELELELCPHRQPGSSTIAINRNAQFRPHTDSGAGAGQSISLIVGLGTYAGGELMVENEQMDIRYKPVEFNGWKQRHWTMPFEGERYSLVWFTPKGCEGMKGIDLSL